MLISPSKLSLSLQTLSLPPNFFPLRRHKADPEIFPGNHSQRERKRKRKREREKYTDTQSGYKEEIKRERDRERKMKARG